MGFNQYSRLETASGYTITVPLPMYKLFRRLQTITAQALVQIYLDGGRVEELFVLQTKKEVLDKG